MNKLTLLLASLTIFCFANCGDSTAPTGDKMAEFAKDSTFKDAHEKPAAIDFQGKGSMVEFQAPDGGRAKAYTLKPATPTNRFLFVVHEWWGLNDQVKQEADRLFGEMESLGVTVMALDMYDGKLTDNPDEAGKIMEAVKPERCEAIIKGALAVAGKDARVATVGWCFGGGWSLRSSILAGANGAGCVMYYGMPVEKAAEIAPLKAEVLGIFAQKDEWINEETIGKFETLAKATGKKVQTRWFEADHAFANPSSPRYNEEAAQQANKLALEFLMGKLK